MLSALETWGDVGQDDDVETNLCVIPYLRHGEMLVVNLPDSTSDHVEKVLRTRFVKLGRKLRWRGVITVVRGTVEIERVRQNNETQRLLKAGFEVARASNFSIGEMAAALSKATRGIEGFGTTRTTDKRPPP